jgi:hypothetical protein
MTTIGIDFKKSIEIYEILQYYPILPKGLHWNMNENQEVVGIYFNKEDEKRLKNEIRDVLWNLKAMMKNLNKKEPESYILK